MDTSKESKSQGGCETTESQYEEIDVVTGETLFKEICERAAERYYICNCKDPKYCNTAIAMICLHCKKIEYKF